MDGFDAHRYGDTWAADYDDLHADLVDTPQTVAGLAELAGTGTAVLEYAAGTGRLAIPLAALGHDVVAVEISEPMLARLRAKPGAERVRAVLGDMTRVALGRVFDLAFVAFNSIFALPTQQDQVALFRNAAAHLRPGGRFALEAMVPREQASRPRMFGPQRLGIPAGTLDPVTGFYQGVWAIVEPSGMRFLEISGRHIGHAEMDLMAQLAGLELEHRWSGWSRAPFTARDDQHVSVYRKPA